MAMDNSTRLSKNISYYDRFATEVGARSDARDFSRALDLFLSTTDRQKTILDIGCGNGTHLEEFNKRGFKALGVEPSPKMRQLCESRGLHAIDGAFENLDSLKTPLVAGIWCAASLLHVPKEDLHKTLKTISDLLPPEAPFYFTVRLGEGAKWDQYDGEGADVARFIQLFNEKDLLDVLSNLPFKNIQSWIEDSTWGRPSKWISVVAVKSDNLALSG
jgi:SAM-dependent methyltransferase